MRDFSFQCANCALRGPNLTYHWGEMLIRLTTRSQLFCNPHLCISPPIHFMGINDAWTCEIATLNQINACFSCLLKLEEVE